MVFSNMNHRWCSWHIMKKLRSKCIATTRIRVQYLGPHTHWSMIRSLFKNFKMVGESWLIHLAYMIMINWLDCMTTEVVGFRVCWKLLFGLGCRQHKEVRVWMYSFMDMCIRRLLWNNLLNGMKVHRGIRSRRSSKPISSHYLKWYFVQHNLKWRSSFS